jgi:WD40 repeat protein
LLLLAPFLTPLTPNPAVAGEIAHTVRLAPGAVDVSGGAVAITDRESHVLRDEGMPALPYLIVNVLLPADERVASHTITETGVAEIAAAFAPPVAPPLLNSEGVAAPPSSLASWSDDGRSFPSVAARYLGTGLLHGRAIASFAVFPVRLHDGSLSSAASIEIRVRTRPASQEEKAVRRLRPRPELDEAVRDRLAHVVVNPEGASAGGSAVAEKRPGGFRPTTFPSLEGSPVDYVIVTTDSLAEKYQRLADFKTVKGVPTVVRTTEWIEANYVNGVDIQETIRTFVIDAYQKWGITYLLLGGDTDQLPARLGASLFLGERIVPVDMYFGCLDGDWNADHDDRFGEPGPTADAPDLRQEVYVGRLPTSTRAEVDLLVDKVIAYESTADAAFTGRVMELAEVLFPLDWTAGEPTTIDGAALAEFVYLQSFTGTPLSVDRKYENYPVFPGSTEETVALSIAALNDGQNHVNHVGHGFRFNMSVGNGSIQNSDADALTNGSPASNFYLLNCTVLAYTYYCLAEHFLRNPNGGAVSCIGANESAFPLASQPYMNEYFWLVFNLDVVNIGEAFVRSRLPRVAIAELGDNADLWTHYIYTILADPEMPLWTRPVQAMSVAHPGGVGMGPAAIAVNVSDAGGPVEGARVCLSKGTEDYEIATTDAGGNASLPFTAESPGDVTIVATAHNRVRYESTIAVTQASSAYVSLAAVALDDTASGTVGNGDGVPDAGETVAVKVDVRNEGAAASGNVSLRLRSNTPGVTVVDSTASVGVVGAGQTASASDAFGVVFDASMADESAAQFSLVVLEDGFETTSDAFVKLVHAPDLTLAVVRVDDSLLGNGDGVVQSGETFHLYFGVKNFGTGAAYGLAAALDNASGGFVMGDSVDAYPDLGPGEDGENLAGFVLTEPDATVENDLSITITDFHGRAYVDTFELRPPAAPGALIFDASLGSDRLQIVWGASPSSDIERYAVYRATTPGGPYMRASVDPVRHTLFLDRGLGATTRYYYVVTAVDSSGNEGPPTSEFSGSTNPAQVEGWPIWMLAETVSSPVIGDIDGDQDYEVVQGDEKVYAWHSNGVEMIDADGNAQTWGLLSTAGNNYVSPIALAPVDGEPGYDIIAASRDTKEIYVFNHQGQVLPGWPQSIERNMRAGLVSGDINADGVREIIAIDERGNLYVFNPDGGEYMDGDNNPGTLGVFKRLPGCVYQYSTPTIADMDMDGWNEIVVGTQGDSVYVFNEDGSSVAGWPVSLLADISGSIAAGDVDGDGDFEIVVSEQAGRVRALRNDGSVLWSRFLPNNLSFAPSPALADLDDDGKLETILPSADRNLYVIRYNGADHPGWPQVYTDQLWTESSPVVADIDFDGILDIVLGDENGVFNGWDAGGNLLAGFPLKMDDAIRGTPTIADFDKDGDTDLIAAGWDKTVRVWDFPRFFNAQKVPWGSFHANLYNDGNTTTDLPTGVMDVAFSWRFRAAGLALEWRLPAEAGYLFDIDRGSVDERGEGVLGRVASAVAVSPDGALRFTDRGVATGERYVYRVSATGDPGRTFTTVPVYIPVSSAALEQNIPNPFNPTTKIVYTVPDGASREVSLVVYDVRGARVRTLVAGAQPGGRHAVEWNGRNDAGERVGSGVYFYRLRQTGFTATRKMLLLK